MTTNDATPAGYAPAMPVPGRATRRLFFHILTKRPRAICNLDCKYCFFLSKETLYPGSASAWTDEVLEAPTFGR